MTLQRAAENGGVGRQSERGNCTRTIGATHPEGRNVIGAAVVFFFVIFIVIVVLPIPVVVWVCVEFDVEMDVVHTQVVHVIHISTLEAHCRHCTTTTMFSSAVVLVRSEVTVVVAP
jgi:hypothetical protein